MRIMVSPPLFCQVIFLYEIMCILLNELLCTQSFMHAEVSALPTELCPQLLLFFLFLFLFFFFFFPSFQSLVVQAGLKLNLQWVTELLFLLL